MRTTAWKTPIRIENPETGLIRTVKTIREAKTVLDSFWPAYHGSQHHRAEEACNAALNGRAEASDARRAFIAAAVEAHFHIQ